MMAALTNHLWQSTVVVCAVALLSLALRRNRASARHALWMAASLKFAVPFSLLIALGGALPWPQAQAPDAPIAPAVAAVVEQFAEPFPADIEPAGPAQAPRSATNLVPTLVASIWAAGFCAVAAMRIRGWRQIRAAVRAGTPVTMADAGFDQNVDVRSTPGLLEPGVVGIWRPILLVPDGLESILTADQLRAVMIHEQHHIHRRDNLTSAIHMAVEAVFWFHPLVWWIGARLIDERERACDEHVLAVGAAPEAYAEGILNVCKRYAESPLACVSGVTGSDLKKRVGAILANRIGARLNLTRRVVLSLVAVVALVAPVLAGAIRAPSSGKATAGKPAVTQASTHQEKFEVASVRPCEDTPSVPGGRRGGVGPVFSPGMLVYNCGTLLQLIHEAYVTNGEPLLNNAPVMRIGAHPIPEIVRGGPDWARTERFMIEAKAATSTGRPADQEAERRILMGPMLRSLLEERFKVVMHRDFEKDVPMYALRVAKGGLKIKPAGPDSCIPNDGSQPPPIPMKQEVERVRDGGKPYCGHGLMGGALGPNHAWVLNGQTLEELAWVLSNMMDRHVIDETGVADKFVMYLEYAPDDMVPFDTAPRGSDPPTAPSITQALKALGLELQPTKAPKQYIVIDHAERPSIAPAEAGAKEGKQKFEVASVRPCENAPSVPGGRNGGVGPVFSPGLFVYNCGTLEQLVNGAYVANGDPLLNDEGRAGAGSLRDEKTFPQRIRGGPDWMRTDRFMIEAKTAVSTGATGREAVPERGVMMGPMLRALLEDRFKLKLHREVQDAVPMYSLTVAKTGLKIKPAGADSCTPPDPNRKEPYQMQEEIDIVRRGGKPICGHGIMGGSVGPNNALVLNAQTMEGVARFLSGVMDRHVLDRTGLTDKFVIYLEYAPDELVPYDFVVLPRTTDPPTAPTITQVLKSLGLELQATKGSKGYIVIDHVERPPFAPASAGASEGRPLRR